MASESNGGEQKSRSSTPPAGTHGDDGAKELEAHAYYNRKAAFALNLLIILTRVVLLHISKRNCTRKKHVKYDQEDSLINEQVLDLLTTFASWLYYNDLVGCTNYRVSSFFSCTNLLYRYVIFYGQRYFYILCARLL